jgi:hypothetical protein
VGGQRSSCVRDRAFKVVKLTVTNDDYVTFCLSVTDIVVDSIRELNVSDVYIVLFHSEASTARDKLYTICMGSGISARDVRMQVNRG